MFLTEQDKEILLNQGYLDKDMDQIDRAVALTDFEIEGEPIDLISLLKVMDRKEFISGMGRSAFHESAVRDTKDGRNVYFDSSKLFKGV